MTRGQARLFWTSTIILTLTGFIYIFMKDFMDSSNPYSVINHPLQPWLLKAHVLAAPFFLVVVSAMFYSHVYPKNASKTRKGRTSGLLNIFLIAVASLSGYLFQVSSAESYRSIWSWVHIVSSSLFVLMILGHFVATYKMRKRAREAGNDASIGKAIFGSICLGVLLLLGSLGCQKSLVGAQATNVEFKRTFLAMGTTFELTFWELQGPRATSIFKEIKTSTENLEKKLTTYRDDSEIAQINQKAGEASSVSVSRETLSILETSMKLHQESKGYFDITVGPFLDLWNFSSPRKGEGIQPPSKKEIERVAPLVGQNALEINSKDKTVRLPRDGMKINLGGIGKGFALDRAKNILEANKVPSAVLNFGGQLLFWGSPPGGDLWRVSIRNPKDVSKVIGLLEVSRGSIATSGDYERYFVFQDKKYFHVINPRSGWPAYGLSSLTVWAPNATDADAWSTALFVMSEKDRKATIQSQNDLGALWVEDDKNQEDTLDEGAFQVFGALEGRFRPLSRN